MDGLEIEKTTTQLPISLIATLTCLFCCESIKFNHFKLTYYKEDFKQILKYQTMNCQNKVKPVDIVVLSPVPGTDHEKHIYNMTLVKTTAYKSLSKI